MIRKLYVLCIVPFSTPIFVPVFDVEAFLKRLEIHAYLLPFKNGALRAGMREQPGKVELVNW